MRKVPVLTLGLLLGSASGWAQSTSIELANLREDVRLLTQKVNELQLKVEDLERENRELSNQSSSSLRAYATVAQLNDAVADLSRQIQKAATEAKQEAKQETLQQVSVQMAKLARETNAALDALGGRTTSTGGAPASPVAPAKFSDDFPKEGIEYVVAKGDTLAVIARKTGGKQSDIINANRISDPSKIQVGQKLFIPLAK